MIFVQAALAGGSPIKIEATSDPATTLREIDRALPVESYLVGWIPHEAPRRLAGALIEQYKSAHLRGEWFKPTPELMGYIVHVAQPTLTQLLAQLPGHSHPEGAVSIEEMARLADVSVSTLRRRVKEGQIPVLRFGRVLRFLPADVIASIQRGG